MPAKVMVGMPAGLVIWPMAIVGSPSAGDTMKFTFLSANSWATFTASAVSERVSRTSMTALYLPPRPPLALISSMQNLKPA